MNRLAVLLVVVLAVSGCGAADGEGLSLNGSGLTVGPSQAARDEIAKTQAGIENTVALAESEARLEREALDGEAERETLGRVGLALALAAVAVGVGYGLKLASPLASQAVAALETALAVRRGRRLEVSLEVGPGGVYQGHLLAEGFSSEELAGVLAGAPALDAPRVLALQERAGGRGLLALQERGLLEGALSEVSLSEASAAD